MASFCPLSVFCVGQKEDIMKTKQVSDKTLVKDLDGADYWLTQLKLLKHPLQNAERRDRHNKLRYGNAALGNGSEGNYALFNFVAIKTTNPEDLMIYNEYLEALNIALNQISPENSALIHQIYYEGVTRQKIAKELKISAVAVGKREKKALKQLYDILKNKGA